ncbi:MAG: hypothetical protein LQ342_006445 [Letrouitia transgressa]|nr:MAG: hypothetical protein LQ342_006445 [Letrouitia transgressa]
MHPILSLSLSFAAPAFLVSTVAAAPPSSLNLTAISAAKSVSILECWQLQPAFKVSSQAGTKGSAIQQLGNLTSATYSVLPARFDGGLHNAPAVQYVILLSGLAHITIPGSKDEAWVLGGLNGLLIAADTADVSAKGHVTQYPSNEVTTALQIATEGEAVPPHTVLHPGACAAEETKLS